MTIAFCDSNSANNLDLAGESGSDADDDQVIRVFSDEESEDEIERYEDSDEEEKQDAISQEQQGHASFTSEDEEVNGETPTCAICLGKLTSQKLPSKPDSGCGHTFCRECLVEWSKKVLKDSKLNECYFTL